MAMINCPECGKEISDKASTCPNCGCPIQQNNIPPNNIGQTPPIPKKKSHGCLAFVIIAIGIFTFFMIIVITIAKDAKQHPEKYGGSISTKYIDVTNEEGKEIDSILKNCGITKVKSFEHDELLDNAHSDGETGYRLTLNDNINNIILYLNADKSVFSISYNTYDLYTDNTVTATIQDYTLTTQEASDLMIQCEEKVKEVLKSPSTAKFPNILQWKFSKEKNITKIQGYVDSQNSLGAEVRSEFFFTIDTDSNTIQSFIFDGQELIQ